jgi:hypothetical protein
MKIAINFIMMYIRLMPADLQSEVYIYINVHLLQRIVLILNFIIVDIEKATCPPSLPPSISDINIFSLATIYIYLQLLFVRHIIRFHKFYIRLSFLPSSIYDNITKRFIKKFFLGIPVSSHWKCNIFAA